MSKKTIKKLPKKVLKERENKNRTFMRHLKMLQMIPDQSFSAITTTEIREKLADYGMQVDIRSIQRDLNNYSGILPLCSEKRMGERENYWYWEKDAGIVVNIPRMNPLTALTFNLVEKFLSPILPNSITGNLQSFFDQANVVLPKYNDSKFSLPKKIKILPRGQTLVPAEIKPGILETVYKALLDGKRFKGSYRKKWDDKPKEYTIHPQGLVFRHEIVYLVCTLWDYKDLKHLALHRFQAAELLDEQRIEPEDFNLDEYIAEQIFSYPDADTPIELKLEFDKDAGRHLAETKLDANQKLTEHEDKIILEATVKDTLELRWWIFAFGDNVTVVEPKELRDDFKERVENMAKAYGVIKN